MLNMPPKNECSSSVVSPEVVKCGLRSIDQFRYIKIQLKAIDLRTRLWGITSEFAGFNLFSRAGLFESLLTLTQH